ncbi:Hypothetical_protein [Hexamita inflata]|uniref:Hypothetical_protein n=1 Tax=Hexamita inflata TaxID=28002 RepID=A0ABP1H6K3_9EUKA
MSSRKIYSEADNQTLIQKAHDNYVKMYSGSASSKYCDSFGNINIYSFFADYMNTTKYSTSVLKDRLEAKRFYDIIQRFFKNYFTEQLKAFITSGIDGKKAYQKIVVKAELLLDEDRFQKTKQQWKDICKKGEKDEDSKVNTSISSVPEKQQVQETYETNNDFYELSPCFEDRFSIYE